MIFVGEGLNYLQSLAKWKGRGEFTLEPLRAVLHELGNPQDAIKTVHVGGTNGKGSVSTFISSILGNAGLKVGLNISPHLVCLNERIVVDGKSVKDEFFNEFGQKLKEASTRAGVSLSFHEAITAVAFLGFKALNVDYGVIEVGLGGRLDASNVIKRPGASIIVSIGHDHEDLLGSGEANIAREKAGIIKAGSKAIVGDLGVEALDCIRQRSDQLGVELHEINLSYNYKVVRDREGVFQDLIEGSEFQFSIQLSGDHQIHNAAIAAKTAKILGISDIDIRNGLSTAFWPARLEHIEYRDKKIILDCAHNKEGVESLVKFLKNNQYQDVTICFGALDTKNWKEMISALAPFARDWRLVEPVSDRAVPEEEIESYLSCFGINSRRYGTNYTKLLYDISMLNSNTLILLTGSIYFVGVFRSLLDISERPLWIKKCKHQI